MSKRPETPGTVHPALRHTGFVTAGWGILLSAAIIFAYAPVLGMGEIWDDDDYLTRNAAVQSPSGLRDVWTLRYDRNEKRLDALMPQYYPLVFTSFWLEYRLWGLHLGGYHAVNLLLHVVNSILVWRIAARLRLPAPWLLGALFGLHPMHVETVAWITERKNVLSGSFYLLSILTYFTYRDRHPFYAQEPIPPGASIARTAVGKRASAFRNLPAARGASKWYAASLALFLCGMLSKTVVCTLPGMLFLLEWWREGRPSWRSIPRLLPYVAIALPLALLTAHLEHTDVGARGKEWSLPLLHRALILMPYTFLHYAGKLLYPSPLIFFYPRPDIIPTDLHWYTPLALTAALFAAAAFARRRYGWGPLLALFASAGTLFPALGLFNVYPFRFSYVADHFCYLGSLGFLALYASIGSRVFGALPRPALVRPPPRAVVAAGLTLMVLAYMTHRETYKYSDEVTLWEWTLAQNPDAWGAMTNVGNIYADRGEYDRAIDLFQRAAQYPAARVDAYGSWANLLLFHLRRFDDAVDKYRLCLEEYGNQWRTSANLSIALKEAGRPAEALATIREALIRDPHRALLWYNLALFLADEGDYQQSALAAEQAFRLEPEMFMAAAVQGEMLVRLGRFQEAIEPLKYAAPISPSPNTTVHLSQALAGVAQFKEAIGVLRAAARFRDAPTLLLQAAYLLSTVPDASMRDGAEAVRLARRAIELRGASPDSWDILATALAETGDFAQAASFADKAATLARQSGNEAQAFAILKRRDAYNQQRPWRITTQPATPH